MATTGHIRIIADCTACPAKRGEPCMTYDGRTANYNHSGRVTLSRPVEDVEAAIKMFQAADA